MQTCISFRCNPSNNNNNLSNNLSNTALTIVDMEETSTLIQHFDDDTTPSKYSITTLLTFWLVIVYLFFVDITSIAFVYFAHHLGIGITIIASLLFVWKLCTFVAGVVAARTGLPKYFTIFQIVKSIQLLFMYDKDNERERERQGGSSTQL
jgi:hypothetical protein